MVDPALTLLIRMLMRAGLRQAWRSMKKPAGVMVTLFMIGMMSFGLIPSIAMAVTSTEQTQSAFSALLTGSIPVLMFAMAAALVATDSGEALLELRPPELQFVLAGPFTNSHILSYRLLTMLIGWVPLCMFFALFMLPHTGSLVGSFFGITLGGAFITLIAFQYTLVKPRLPPGVLSIIRLAALFGLMFIALESSVRVMGSDDPYSISMLSQAINDGWSARILSFPFRPFAAAISGPIDHRLLLNIAMSFALVTLAGLCCYRTNGGFSEMAVEGVARRKKKLDRIKGGNVYGVSTRKKERSQLIPTLGWMGGVGPVAWSQLTSVLRRTGRLVPGLICIGAVAAVVAAVLLQLYPDEFRHSALLCGTDRPGGGRLRRFLNRPDGSDRVFIKSSSSDLVPDAADQADGDRDRYDQRHHCALGQYSSGVLPPGARCHEPIVAPKSVDLLCGTGF